MARLDESLTINEIRLRNRLAMAPITTYLGSPEGEVTPAILGFYRQRSRDVGLVIVEAAGVSPDGRINPCSLGLWNGAQVKKMKELVNNLKGEGAAAVVQLNHAGARSVPVPGGIHGGSPSGVAFRSDVDPIILTTDQIHELVRSFAEAADRAAEAGFDGIELHGAHLFLLSQFLSPLTNRRSDRYGGDAVGRAALGVEVVRAVRVWLGKGFPILFRVNAIERIDGGQTLEDSTAIAVSLEAAGADAIHVSMVGRASWSETAGRPHLRCSSVLRKDEAFGANLANAGHIKKSSGVPIIGVGKLGDSATAARAVGEGLVDVVAIGRQMIADPGTGAKILAGRDGEVMRCKECLTCFASIAKGPIRCSINLNLAGDPVYA